MPDGPGRRHPFRVSRVALPTRRATERERYHHYHYHHYQHQYYHAPASASAFRLWWRWRLTRNLNRFFVRAPFILRPETFLEANSDNGERDIDRNANLSWRPRRWRTESYTRAGRPVNCVSAFIAGVCVVWSTCVCMHSSSSTIGLRIFWPVTRFVPCSHLFMTLYYVLDIFSGKIVGAWMTIYVHRTEPDVRDPSVIW